MNSQLIFDPLNRILWLMAIFLILICGVNFIIRIFQNERRDEKKILLGFSILFICLAIARFLSYVADFFLEGNYEFHSYYGNYSDPTSIFLSINNLAHVTWFIGITLYFFLFENATKRSYYILTITNLIFVILLFINQNLFLFFSSIDIIITFLFFIKFSNLSSKEFQMESSMALMGIILFWIGYFIEITAVREDALITSTFPSFLFIIGALLQFPYNLLKQALFTNSILFLSAIGFSLLFNGFSFVLLTIFSLALILYVFMLLYTVSRAVIIIKAGDIIDIEEISDERGELFDFLRLTNKMKKKKLTEEEITFYKEQKICLICKGKTKGFVLICSHCDVIYCKKCAEYLIDLENQCWACHEVLDPTKRVKNKKTTVSEEKVNIETISQKGRKTVKASKN